MARSINRGRKPHLIQMSITVANVTELARQNAEFPIASLPLIHIITFGGQYGICISYTRKLRYKRLSN